MAAVAQSDSRNAPVFVINDGDSLLAENGSPRSRATSLKFALQALGGGAEGATVAISGTTMNQAVARFSANVGPHIVHDRPVILHILSGGNDLRKGTPPGKVFELLRDYVALAQSFGMKTVVSTYPLQCDVLQNPDWKTSLHRLNELVYVSWARPREEGGLGADGLVDYFADREIGPGDYDRSAFCDRKRSPDNLHFSDDGKVVMGEIEADAIRALIARQKR